MDPGPYAPADGSVNLQMVMICVAGAIAEELVTSVAYGSDGLDKSDYDGAIAWASRGGEIEDPAQYHPVLRQAWADAESCLKRRWSLVVALAREILARKVLTGTEVLSATGQASRGVRPLIRVLDRPTVIGTIPPSAVLPVAAP